jgi:hypothetical protein
MIAQAGLAVSGIGLARASLTHAPLAWIYFFLFCTATFRALGWPAGEGYNTARPKGYGAAEGLLAKPGSGTRVKTPTSGELNERSSIRGGCGACRGGYRCGGGCNAGAACGQRCRVA